MDRLSAALDNYKASGLGLLRVMAALIIFQAGYTKIFVWGMSATAGNFQKMGLILPQVVGPFIGVLELAGGALLTLGLFTRYLGLIFAVEFGVAAYMVAVVMGRGTDAARLPFLLVIVMLALATNGGGALNLGTMLRRGA
jgi:putative oxidoreductase